jgi:hypothetical protein
MRVVARRLALVLTHHQYSQAVHGCFFLNEVARGIPGIAIELGSFRFVRPLGLFRESNSKFGLDLPHKQDAPSIWRDGHLRTQPCQESPCNGSNGILNRQQRKIGSHRMTTNIGQPAAPTMMDDL